jgi:putative spermidine/putrescine transport system permease protein
MTLPPAAIWLRLGPILIPLGVIFFGGAFMALAQALGYFSLVPLEPGWSVGFGRMVSSPAVLKCFIYSLWVAFGSALGSVALGTLVAFMIWRLPAALQKLAVVYKLSLVLPHVAVAFVTLILFSQSGVLASLAHFGGLIEKPAEFPVILFGGDGLGLILAYVYKGAAFVILLVYSMLQRLDPRYLQTASMLGAGRSAVFMRVIYPHVRPAMHTGFIILFLYSIGGFDIPYLVGESQPSMISIKVYNLYFKRDLIDRPEAMAILTSLFVFSSFFIWAYGRVTHRLSSQERKL